MSLYEMEDKWERDDAGAVLEIIRKGCRKKKNAFDPRLERVKCIPFF
jgi:hypothetical protein